MLPPQKFLFPAKAEMPDYVELPLWDHLEELRERVMVAGLACAAAILTCFCFSKARGQMGKRGSNPHAFSSTPSL